MLAKNLRRSPKAIAATMLAAVMIFGTVITAFAADRVKPQDQVSDLRKVNNLIKAETSYEPGAAATITVKPNQLANAGITGTEGVDYHFEWYCQNVSAPADVTVATINRKSGALTVSSYNPPAGESVSAMITVYVVKGSTYETGDGKGPWYPTVTGEPGDYNVMAYAEATFTVSHTSTDEYGWQGTGGLQMLMTDPSAISASGSIDDVTGIVNTITNPVTLTDDTAQFKFQLSAGLNTTTAFTDRKNLERVRVYAFEDGEMGEEAVGTIADLGTDLTTTPSPTVTLSVSGLSSGSYVIVFDSTIQGGNTQKTLGTNVYFIFTVQ